MEPRPLLKPALAIALALALVLAQLGAAAAMPIAAHAKREARVGPPAHAMNSDCSRRAAKESPADPSAQEPAPVCCDVLGRCPLQNAVTGTTFVALPVIATITFPPVTMTGAEREVPPDPFPPRS